MKLKDIDTAVVWKAQREALIALTDAIARPGDDAKHDDRRLRRSAGDVFIREVVDGSVRVHPTIAPLIDDAILFLFMDEANRAMLKALDAKVQFLGERLQELGVDLR